MLRPAVVLAAAAALAVCSLAYGAEAVSANRVKAAAARVHRFRLAEMMMARDDDGPAAADADKEPANATAPAESAAAPAGNTTEASAAAPADEAPAAQGAANAAGANGTAADVNATAVEVSAEDEAVAAGEELVFDAAKRAGPQLPKRCKDYNVSSHC